MFTKQLSHEKNQKLYSQYKERLLTVIKKKKKLNLEKWAKNMNRNFTTENV